MGIKEQSGTSHLIPVTWDSVAQSIAKMNPELAEIINELCPNKKLKLFIARYDYGDLIVRNGVFQIQDNGHFYPIGHHNLPNNVNDSLSYNLGSNPACILLRNQIELFIEREFTPILISFGTLSPGRLFSTSLVIGKEHTFQPGFNWSISAGARSIFLLPKITNSRSFKRLRKNFNLSSDIPNSYIDQWYLFKELNRAAELNWSLEILYFSKEWFQHLNDSAWVRFHNYLLSSFHQSYQFWTFKFMWDMVTSFILTKRSLKPSLYIVNTMKHLLFMAAGVLPGMAPATTNNAGPIEAIQNIFNDIYGITKYSPTIMVPSYFNLHKKSNLTYYSLQYPNLMEMTIRPRLHDSILSDTFEIHAILEKCLQHLQDADLNLAGSVLYDIPNKVNFSFFHNFPEKSPFFLDSSIISQDDQRFTQSIDKATPMRPFNENATFVRGCVRISHKN